MIEDLFTTINNMNRFESLLLELQQVATTVAKKRVKKGKKMHVKTKAERDRFANSVEGRKASKKRIKEYKLNPKLRLKKHNDYLMNKDSGPVMMKVKGKK